MIRQHDWMLAWVSLIHAADFMRHELEARLKAELGIGLAEQDLLKEIAINRDHLTLTELARRMFFSKAGITKLLDRLEKRNLVRRQAIEGDRRSLQAVLTAEGRIVFQRSRFVIEGFVEENFRAHLSDKHLLGLKSALRAFLESHDRWQDQMEQLCKNGHE